MMRDQKKQVSGRLLQVILVTALLVCGLAAGFDFYYDLNDDTTIKDILSGAYTGTPSGYTIQMLYPLGFLIASLYRAIPGVAWYGLFLCLCQFGVFSLIAYRLTNMYSDKKARVFSLAVALLLFTGLLFRELVIIQYSITSAICMAGAIFLYVTAELKETTAGTIKDNVLPVILVILSFMIRTEMCLMLLPFLFLAGFFRLLEDCAASKNRKGDIIRRNLILVGLAFIGMVGMLCIDGFVKRPDSVEQNWSRFDSFFEARTKLYDFYDLPQYEANAEFYHNIGLSRESYELLKNYNFSLDESIDEHLLQEIVSYIEYSGGEVNGLHSIMGVFYAKHSLKEGIWLYKQRLLTGAGGIFEIINACMYLICFLILAKEQGRERFLQMLKVMMLFMVRSGLFLYLLMVDRMLSRVTVPIYLAEFTVLVAWQLVCLQKRKNIPAKALFFALLLMCGLTSMCYNGKRTMEEYQARERINPRWETFMEYCQYFPDDFFVMDVYSSTSYDGVVYAEKIFKDVDNSMKNYDICGGWLAKSPLYRQKLERFAISDLETSLCQKEKKTFFVAAHQKDLSWLSAYYCHKGQKIQMEQVDTIWYQNEAIFDVYALIPEE